MVTVLVATGNHNKVREMHQIAAGPDIELVSAAEAGTLPDVVEDGETFQANAVKKACACADANRRPALADDSGLEVEALAGAPGVYSARYAGEKATDEANVSKLLTALAGEGSNRNARFVCVIAVALPGKLVGTAQGVLHGRIVREPRGSNGFGYDPVFVPRGCTCTFAEMAPADKNQMSHRAEALRAAVRNGLFVELKRLEERRS